MTAAESSTPPHSEPTRLAVAAGMSIAVLGLSLASAGAYFLMGLVHKQFGFPGGLPAQIANVLLSVSIFIFATFLFRLFRYGKMDHHVFGFTRTLEAMDRIAKGDFSVRLPQDRDNDRLIEVHRRFNAMAEGLDQMERMRREFVSNVSHEIQSPLTSIRGFAGALRGADLAAEDRSHYLDVIEAESVRLSKLSDGLLKLASLESESTKPALNTFRLDAQIRNVVLAAEPQWLEKRLELEVADEEASVTADEELLGQVWVNLLNNAIKFTPTGGKVSVSLVTTDSSFEIKFTDTGIGIGQEDLPWIFDRFYKADKSRRWSESSNGLGLSIAKRIVELHGGSIAAESHGCAGTKMTVTLPKLKILES